MASSTKLLAVLALLATASLGAVLLSSTRGAGVPWGGATSSSILTTLPFSPMDVLPLLPRRVSMAALRALRGASDIFPVFVGAATAVPAADAAAGSGVVGWKGACFYENEAWLEFNNDSGTAYGGGTVHIKWAQQATSNTQVKLERLEQQTRNRYEQATFLKFPPRSFPSQQHHQKFQSIARPNPRLPAMAMGGSRLKLLLLPVAVLLLGALLFAASRGGLLLRVPVLPGDLLPLLPWSVARPLLQRLALNSAADLLPAFVGAARVPGTGGDEAAAAEWKGACFYENTAWMEFHESNGTDGGLGGGTVHLETSQAHSWTCMDLYVFATPYRVTWDYYFLGREHTLEITEWESKAEYEYVKHNGVSIFLMPSGTIGTLRALWDVFPLFTNTGWGENSNLAFLKKHMGANFEERPKPWVSELNVDDIHSGDFLVLSKIRGRWGGFETLEKWVTGAYAGHTAVCLRDSEGKLWVGESGHENEQGEDIIAILPWEEWWDFEVTTDDSNPQIALLPLRPDLRAKFNETAAWNYAKQMNGKPYGYHNLIFSWIDTISDNYPPPLDAHVVASVMTVWNKLQPDYAANMWTEALNKRLGTEGLDLPEIIVEAEKRGITFDKLLTVPEKDDWVYNDGQSASCVAYVLMMYKEAGLFDPLSSSIEVTEFTIKDAYVLNFFEANTTRLPAWCNKDDTVKLPFCQIKGRYRMELPGYNTMEPYAHMNERCASLPPDYLRTKDC